MKYDNSGKISKNLQKKTDKHPDQQGKCTIDGKEYWISGWIKEGKDGKFLSLAFRPKDATKNPEPPTDDSDLPF
jgi:cytochrome b involved in lipid metabolism